MRILALQPGQVRDTQERPVSPLAISRLAGTFVDRFLTAHESTSSY
jgi:hypothetical protein